MNREELGILVVDDSAAVRHAVRELLYGAGFKRITLAAHAEEARRFLEMETCHLVISDWRMEPTNGLDLLRYMRAEPLLKETLFILLTAEMDKEKALFALAQGVDDYLIKPLNSGHIQSKIYGHLLRKQLLS
jgi:two-component system, chemotaxis family, chemotaxis protein CheY